MDTDKLEPQWAADCSKFAPLVYTVDPLDPLKMDVTSDGARTRKRQRPSAPYPQGGSVAFTEFKVDIAGYDTDNHMPPYAADQALVEPSSSPAEVQEFLKALHLSFQRDPVAVAQVNEKLHFYGFDTLVALAFATVDDLQHCGVSPMDAQVLYQQSRREFTARHFLGPELLSGSYTVSRWLILCGIPSTRSFEYAERLCRLGYASVLDLELILHDEQALSVFKMGHCRLFIHCISVALSQPRSNLMFNGASGMALSGPIYDGGSSSALLQPLEIHPREGEVDDRVVDSFLDSLMHPVNDVRFTNQTVPAPGLDQYPHASDDTGSPSGDSDSYTPDEFFGMHNSNGMSSMSFGQALAAAADGSSPSVQPQASSSAMRDLPYDLLQLLYEAVNMPRPNPCRRGKKIYWSVLANKGMKEERFAVLEHYTAAELQNAYLRQFELPANSNNVKSDAWSEENIRQLEHAVKDPRCRHLSKVCWEMLATGRTGVEEYAPLAKFTASQLRSRFRSLFGDKRPQKLRQKKQLLKMQQQQQLQQHAK